jgi:hypothetical protein
MSSRDGITFHRWNDPVIPQTAPKDRDGNRSNYMANGLVQLPDNDREYAVYATEAYYQGPDSRLRRFTYRIDGFVSIRSEKEGGKLITRPIVFDGDVLIANFATKDSESIKVDALTEDGKSVASAKLMGDEVAHKVKWQSDSDLSKLAGRPIRLRFSMKNADLYSIQFATSTK